MQRKPALPLDDRPKCPKCGGLYPENPCTLCPGNVESEREFADWSDLEKSDPDHYCVNCGSPLTRRHWHLTHCFDCHPVIRASRTTYCEVIGHRGPRRLYGGRVARGVVKTPVRGELRECWVCDVCVSKGLAQYYSVTEGEGVQPAHVERATLRLFAQAAEQPRLKTWVGDSNDSRIAGIWLSDGVEHRSFDGKVSYVHIQVSKGYVLKVREDRLGSDVDMCARGMAVIAYGYQPTVVDRFGSISDLWAEYPECKDEPVRGRIV